MSRHATLSAIVCAALYCAPCLAQEKALSTITLRASQALPKAMQEVLTDVAATTTRKVAAGSDPFSVIRSHCGGSFTNDYYADAVKANPGFVFAKESRERTLKLPACAKVGKYTAVEVVAGDTLESITKRNLGVQPEEPISICDEGARPAKGAAKCVVTAREALARLNGGASAGLDDLKAGRMLSLPTKTRTTTVVLKQGVDAGDAIRRLEEAMANVSSAAGTKPLTQLHTSPEMRLMQPLQTSDARVKGSACDPEAAAPAGAWPFDAEQLGKTLDRNRALAKKKSIVVQPSVVRIADTGGTGLGTYFPKAALAVNEREMDRQDIDRDGNGYYGDYYGVSATQTDSVLPFADDPYKLHGTQVGDLALGGREFRAKYKNLKDHVKISFVKIFWKRPGNLSVNDSTMNIAMTQIANHPLPSVVNYSVGADDEGNTRQFVDTLLNARQLGFLVVIAAGNNGDDITNTPLYPASYGGTGSPAADWIIAVAASGPDRKPAKFSNFSRQRVDLLAPGCRLPYVAPSGETSLLHGTSLAAPLVSFAAALVRSLGVTNAQHVKARLIASADFDPELLQRARYGAILNVERAAAVFQDSLRLKGQQQDLRGTWILEDAVADLCADMRPWAASRIRAVQPFRDVSGALKLRLLTAGQDRRLSDPEECTPKGQGIQFQDEAGGKRSHAWSDIATLVPAYPDARQ
jgi:subtilisin family serine protease